MVTRGSSVTARTRAESPKGAARAAKRRGYEVSVDGRSQGALAERRRGWRGRLHTTLELIRANPTGRVALKVFIGILGALVVTVGIALIPLPGPGWLLVIAGLGVWAVEFHWARRLLAFTRRHVNSWTRWVTSRSLGVRFVLGAVGLVFVSVVVWLSLKYSLGIDVVARAMHYLATH
ncbi:TIGR02611 family protein [Micromonospora sp. WMMA1998]|uniref:TIGR02611 family protein n=1 Tax=Micromonospora TaxID=1873 RepID=UPI001561C051|nr:MULTISPECIES: TIGR02611 family protein [unclassified Micromonospora]WBC14848.1 TIGR02611 family protein [Micromonospora sp. WMMA1998]